MKVARNACKKEFGEMKSVNPVKSTTQSSDENFQRQLPFREICVKYLEKSNV